jgi:hypothetical protein
MKLNTLFLSDYTVVQLKKYAKYLGIKYLSKMRKVDIITSIQQKHATLFSHSNILIKKQAREYIRLWFIKHIDKLYNYIQKKKCCICFDKTGLRTCQACTCHVCIDCFKTMCTHSRTMTLTCPLCRNNDVVNYIKKTHETLKHNDIKAWTITYYKKNTLMQLKYQITRYRLLRLFRQQTFQYKWMDMYYLRPINELCARLKNVFDVRFYIMENLIYVYDTREYTATEIAHKLLSIHNPSRHVIYAHKIILNINYQFLPMIYNGEFVFARI